ncbi:MAG: transcriptional regulator [Candidatus Berkelbacteria bacterium]|nr:transcriptional regulator [Candidatus Berkelbacteria bacterium]
MEKSDLIIEAAKEANISQEEATKILDSFVETIKEGLVKGEKVTISGFGTFSLAKRKAREFINPKTKTVHNIPEKSLPFFRPGTNFFPKN